MRRFLAIVAPLAGLCVLSWCQTFWSAAAVVALPACQSGDAGGVQPITGVEVIASDLVAGHGCGTGPGQIYKYAVVAQIPLNAGYSFDGFFVAGGVYDCFSDAVLQQLCTYPYVGNIDNNVANSNNSNIPNSASFAVTVYAFTAAQWNSPTTDGGATTVGSTVQAAFPADQSFAGYAAYCQANEANPQIPETPAVVLPAVTLQMSALAGYSVWTTTCSAVEQSDVPVVADCASLKNVQQ